MGFGQGAVLAMPVPVATFLGGLAVLSPTVEGGEAGIVGGGVMGVPLATQPMRETGPGACIAASSDYASNVNTHREDPWGQEEPHRYIPVAS